MVNVIIMTNINEMIAIVQVYIHHRTNKQVNIRITSLGCVAKLTRAYNIAIDWLNNNGFKQVL